ncbi:hypothetical protein C8Q70DRAFT_309840 [Cubamyces menziesii]|nr:hypothetical protein C8Q70DRAFT_309840 [Cubamyces menziesii]
MTFRWRHCSLFFAMASFACMLAVCKTRGLVSYLLQAAHSSTQPSSTFLSRPSLLAVSQACQTWLASSAMILDALWQMATSLSRLLHRTCAGPFPEDLLNVAILRSPDYPPSCSIFVSSPLAKSRINTVHIESRGYLGAAPHILPAPQGTIAPPCRTHSFPLWYPTSYIGRPPTVRSSPHSSCREDSSLKHVR